ncbi:MAG: NAD(P)-dependent oxidoreductase [Spirochaetaceae bacterium]|jgi:dTDP-6-deoxy-L-talose 4-dehydrogenase (NAD+)|nr:NAD(P)-dependent oxidoreductase [Spirochaetaceae bacterium]
MNLTKRVLVTGAGGYIGRFVVAELLDGGHNVVAVSSDTSRVDSRALRIETDLFSLNNYAPEEILVKLGNPDICLHLAWKDGFVHNADSHMEMLSAHYKFLKKITEGGGVKQLAVMGSMHEVGYYNGKIDEDTPCNPISLYGIAKDSLRRSLLLMANAKDLVFQWLRGFYVLGDDINNKSVFSKIMQAEEEGKEFFPFTTGKNRYDFIEVTELAKQIALCITQENVNGIINCCSGMPVSLADRVEQFIQEKGLKIKLQYGIYPDRPYDSPEVYGDNSKIKTILKTRN